MNKTFRRCLVLGVVACGFAGVAGAGTIDLSNLGNFNIGDILGQIFGLGGGLGDLFNNVKSTTRSVPEPETLGLLGIGLVGIAAGLRRRRSK